GLGTLRRVGAVRRPGIIAQRVFTRRRGAARYCTPPTPGPAEARSVVARSLRRTMKDFWVVDGEEGCAGAGRSTRRAVLRVAPRPPRASREITSASNLTYAAL